MIDNKTYIKISGSSSFLPGEPIPRSELDIYLGVLTQAPSKVKRWLDRIGELMDELIEAEYFHLAIDPHTRRFTEDNVTMATKAALAALENAGLSPGDIDLIVYGSPHQDQMPTASVRIQEALGIESCAEISVHANCTSAYKSLLLGTDLIRNGRYRNALVLSSNMSSSELVAEYYNQPLVTREEVFLRYFLSDGAAALVLEASEEVNNGLFIDYNYIESIGGNKQSAMGNKRPARYINPKEEFEQGLHHLSQKFQSGLRDSFHDPDGSVFYKGLQRMLNKYPIDLEKIKYFQVNFPSKHISSLIMDECAGLGINPATLYTRMATMGYPGPPMALIALDKIRKEEELLPGDIILSFVTEVSKFMQAGYILHQA
jgi:3-oxoacyl-[acyl-carrier-protein] synthase III